MLLRDLEPGQIAKAEGRFFFCDHGGFRDEFKQRIYPANYYSRCEIVDRPRYLTEDTAYRCRTKWREIPAFRIVIADFDGYRHAIEIVNWCIRVYFAFTTRDARCPRGLALFSSSSGRFAKLLVDADSFAFHIDASGATFCEVDGETVGSDR